MSANIRNTPLNRFKLNSMFYLRKYPRTNVQITEQMLKELFQVYTKNKRFLDIEKSNIKVVKSALDSGNTDHLIKTVEQINPHIIDFSENESVNMLLPWWMIVILVICLIIVNN